MTSAEVKYYVFTYLRYQRQCPLVTFERALHCGVAVPDILAVDKSRYLTEVEVKVSLADFRADTKKRKWNMQARGFRVGPRKFYYAAPNDLAIQIKEELPDHAGLLSVSHQVYGSGYDKNNTFVLATAPVNKKAKRLTTKELIAMVKNQTGTLASALRDNNKIRKQLEKQEDGK